jgi:hypothetical protein
MRWARIALFGAITALGLIVLACAETPENVQPQQGAESDLCADLDDLRSAASRLGNLSTSSTLSEITSALNAVLTALGEVLQSAASVAGSQGDALRSALNNIETSIRSALNSGSISSAITGLQDARADLESAWNDVKDRANCD